MPEQPCEQLNRVTAGLPAVDPARRFQRERRERTREKQRVALAEAENKRQAAVAPDGSRPTISWAAQAGIALHSSELIRRLSSLSPSLWFERHPYISSVMAIYARNPEGGRKFICGFEAEVSPEFEVRNYHEEETAVGWGNDIHLETVKVCDGTTRGWRTVLSRLIKAGLITQAGADRMFGEPSHESQYWKLAIS